MKHTSYKFTYLATIMVLVIGVACTRVSQTESKPKVFKPQYSAVLRAADDNKSGGRCVVNSVADGLYTFGMNNCHHHANEFCDKNGGSVVHCDTGGGFTGHTVNIVSVDGMRACLVDPQSDDKCCFEGSIDTCGNHYFDINQDPAKSCANQVCRSKNTCKIMPPEYRAPTIQKAIENCSEQMQFQESCRDCMDYVAAYQLNLIKNWVKEQPLDCAYDDGQAVINFVEESKSSCDGKPVLVDQCRAEKTNSGCTSCCGKGTIQGGPGHHQCLKASGCSSKP